MHVPGKIIRCIPLADKAFSPVDFLNFESVYSGRGIISKKITVRRLRETRKPVSKKYQDE